MLFDAYGREIPAPGRRRKRFGFVPSDPTEPEPEGEGEPADAIATEQADTDTHEAIECKYRT